MRTILVLLLLVAAAQAQTKPTTKLVRKPTTTERLDKLEASLQVTVQSRDDLKAENERLQTANKDLSDKNVELEKKYVDLRASALEVHNFNNRLDAEYKKLSDEHGKLIDHYNSALNQANAYIQQANARLARQSQINNALAMYSLMPKWSPPAPIQIYHPPPSLQMNCIARTSGNTTYTDCH